MRIILTVLFLSFFSWSQAQNPALAKNYFDQGEFDKALVSYRNLSNAQPGRIDYFLGMIHSLQQLENYEEAEKLMEARLRQQQRHPQLYVELGHNFALQNKEEKALENYQKAILAIEENEHAAYPIATTFQKYNLLEEAAASLEKAMSLNTSRDYSIQLAQIYGEQGKLEKMFEAYLNVIERNENFKNTAQRYFSLYITEDPANEANDIFRKTLLKRSQQSQLLLYNELLSWLFIQQKEYGKALVQERAIHRRNPESLNRMIDLGTIAMNEKDYETAQNAIHYIIEHATTKALLLQANQLLLQIDIELATPDKYAEIQKKFQDLITQFGTGSDTHSLQIAYNHFLAFDMDEKQQAISNLRAMLDQRMNPFQEARIKMELADILVADEKFNQALIYYSQIQSKIQNDILAQEARFKVARTSYFKGDFDWALTQLDVLKKSTSQLIANDALQLSLLITDNSLEDSTQTALKKYARADLLNIQEKNQQAIDVLNEILLEHPGSSIADEALLLQGKIFEKIGEYAKAEENYLKIIQYHSYDILADDALFRLGTIYQYHLNEPDKAKMYYEKIIFEHADSIFFVEARKRYRMLRDNLIN
ncbi:MAG: tetratricopeptide repeat protein [Bacteroidetes bacterium]|nr:tetratricopeptide repeat protein [Bacteroidota bacterium]